MLSFATLEMTVFASDPDLLRRFRKGERAALAHVYGHYVGAIESVIRGVAAEGRPPARGAIPRADLADLVQEVFVKAFAEPARLAYDGVREYRPLLTAIARNVTVDHFRLRAREVHLAPGAIELLCDRDASIAAAEGPWADTQTMHLVEHYLAGLSQIEQAVYLQRYVRCRSQAEAAAALGLSRQQLRTVEAHIRRGLARELARADLRHHPIDHRVALSPHRGADGPHITAEPESNR